MDTLTAMSAPGQLTHRDREILVALLTRVRLFSQRQLAETWFHSEVANARRRLRFLEGAGLVQSIQVAARPLPPVDSPVFCWKPGDLPPDAGAVSFQLVRRWKGRAVRFMTAVVATHEAQRLCGGRGRKQLPHPTQATHDLGVAAVWLSLRRQQSPLADAWRGEDLLAADREGGKLPDAFLVDSSDRVTAAIEFGGAYRPERVRDFHEHCSDRSLPYWLY